MKSFKTLDGEVYKIKRNSLEKNPFTLDRYKKSYKIVTTCTNMTYDYYNTIEEAEGGLEELKEVYMKDYHKEYNELMKRIDKLYKFINKNN